VSPVTVGWLELLEESQWQPLKKQIGRLAWWIAPLKVQLKRFPEAVCLILLFDLR